VSDTKLNFYVRLVVDGDERPDSHAVGLFEHRLGVLRSITTANLLLRDTPEASIARVYALYPGRDQDTYLGSIEAGERKLKKETLRG
jgi:hypothetical protein